MSIEDEIRQRKEELQAKQRAEEEQTRRSAEWKKALEEHGFHDWLYPPLGLERSGPPILQLPSPELRALMEEARPSMVYIKPKIIRGLPDGTTRCRPTNPGESPDTYSLDVLIGQESSSSDSGEEYWAHIWFFANGMVAFVIESASARDHYKHHVFSNWDDNYYYSLGTRDILKKQRTSILSNIADIRRKLIDQIIKDSEEKAEADKRPEPVKESQQPETPAKADGCYIATSVYGSCDCPEVRVLRRYRDVVLRANPLGRLFVRIYYAVSPFLVKRFGKTAWFQKLWRRLLDAKIAALRAEGISGGAYRDRGARRL